MVLQVTMVYR